MELAMKAFSIASVLVVVALAAVDAASAPGASRICVSGRSRPAGLPFTAIARTVPTRADLAGGGSFVYEPTFDQISPPTTVPADIELALNVTLAQACDEFVGVVHRGFTDGASDGPVQFAVAKTVSAARWFATVHKLGLSSGSRERALEDPGLYVYSSGSSYWAAAVRGTVVVFAP